MQVWARDTWLDILGNFLHLERKEGTDKAKTVRETLIFPRYHQLDVVTRLLEAARAEGVGQSYLVQHSAGSGKSNSIAWCAHRLASLHNAADERVFDSVIVITDRRVLDEVTVACVLGAGRLQEACDDIELVVAREDEGLARGLRLVRALFALQVQEVAQDIEPGVASPYLHIPKQDDQGFRSNVTTDSDSS